MNKEQALRLGKQNIESFKAGMISANQLNKTLSFINKQHQDWKRRSDVEYQEARHLMAMLCEKQNKGA